MEKIDLLKLPSSRVMRACLVRRACLVVDIIDSTMCGEAAFNNSFDNIKNAAGYPKTIVSGH